MHNDRVNKCMHDHIVNEQINTREGLVLPGLHLHYVFLPRPLKIWKHLESLLLSPLSLTIGMFSLQAPADVFFWHKTKKKNLWFLLDSEFKVENVVNKETWLLQIGFVFCSHFYSVL